MYCLLTPSLLAPSSRALLWPPSPWVSLPGMFISPSFHLLEVFVLWNLLLFIEDFLDYIKMQSILNFLVLFPTLYLIPLSSRRAGHGPPTATAHHSEFPCRVFSLFGPPKGVLHNMDCRSLTWSLLHGNYKGTYVIVWLWGLVNWCLPISPNSYLRLT